MLEYEFKFKIGDVVQYKKEFQEEFGVFLYIVHSYSPYYGGKEKYQLFNLENLSTHECTYTHDPSLFELVHNFHIGDYVYAMHDVSALIRNVDNNFFTNQKVLFKGYCYKITRISPLGLLYLQSGYHDVFKYEDNYSQIGFSEFHFIPINFMAVMAGNSDFESTIQRYQLEKENKMSVRKTTVTASVVVSQENTTLANAQKILEEKIIPTIEEIQENGDNPEDIIDGTDEYTYEVLHGMFEALEAIGYRVEVETSHTYTLVPV